MKDVEKTNKIISMYKQGVSLDDIATYFGITIYSVKYHLRKTRKINSSEINKCVRCKRLFKSPESLAGHMGYCIPWKKSRKISGNIGKSVDFRGKSSGIRGPRRDSDPASGVR